MEKAFTKIKLEEEVQGNRGSSFQPISSTAAWDSPLSVLDQAIFQEASDSFDQLIESYKWKKAGHPVTIKIEEVQEPQEVEVVEVVIEEIPEESVADRVKRQRLERAVRRGRKKARQADKILPNRVRPLGLIPVFEEVSEDQPDFQQELLAGVATCAANFNPNPIDILDTYQTTEIVDGVYFEVPRSSGRDRKPAAKHWDC